MSAEVVGLVDLPAALSITWVVLSVPCTFSEVIALEIVERTSSGYLGAQLFAGFMYIAAAGSLYAVRSWKVGDLRRVKLRLSSAGSVVDEKAEVVSFRQRFFAWVKV